MDTFERPNYVNPHAVPVLWAVPSDAYTLDASAHSIPMLAEMISKPLAGKPRDESTTVTFQISSEEHKSVSFHGGITQSEAEQLLTAVLG